MLRYKRLSMKTSLIHAFFLFFICSQSTILDAEFVSGSIWHKKMHNDQLQNIIFIGNHHDKNNQEQIEDLLAKIPEGALALVEDTPSLYYKSSWTPWSNQSWKPCNLNYLTPKINGSTKAQAVNVDFRMGRFIMDKIDQYGHWNYNFCAGVKCFEQFISYIHQWKQESMSYNDSESFKHAYAFLRQGMLSHETELHNFKQRLSLACERNEQKFSCHSPILNSILLSIAAELDVRILHHIYNNADKKFIFVLVGDAHKTRMEQVMHSLGYKQKGRWYQGTSLSHFLDFVSNVEAKSTFYEPVINFTGYKFYCENDATQKDDKTKKANLNYPLSAACVAPAFKYAPTQWPQWKKKQPTYRNPFTGFKQTVASWWRKPMPTLSASLRTLPVRLNAMPRCFKLGGLAATAGIGLMLGTRK